MNIETRLFNCPKCGCLNVAVDSVYRCGHCGWQPANKNDPFGIEAPMPTAQQPARPKRKELEAELAELKVQLADWKRWHQFREEELKVANAELESMHRELADKQAIIDEQEREIDELHAPPVTKWITFVGALKERDEARRWAIKLRDEVLKLREWGKKDKAIIDLLEKERDDLKRELEAAKRTHTYTYILPMQKLRMIPTTAGKWKK